MLPSQAAELVEAIEVFRKASKKHGAACARWDKKYGDANSWNDPVVKTARDAREAALKALLLIWPKARSGWRLIKYRGRILDFTGTGVNVREDVLFIE